MSKKIIPLHTPGQVRYFTHYLYFPHDNDVWIDQEPFIHDLIFEFKRTQWAKFPNIIREFLTNGEISYEEVVMVGKHKFKVRHRYVIDDVKREKKWGMNSKLLNERLISPA